VSQLDTGDSALGGNEAGYALQGFDLFIVPQTKILSGDPAVGGHRRGFGKNQAGTAHGTTAKVNKMPVIGQPIDAGVLAHRRDRDAVEQRQLTNGVGFKQQTHGAPLNQWSGSRVLFEKSTSDKKDAAPAPAGKKWTIRHKANQAVFRA
jgi:hypothetical protein